MPKLWKKFDVFKKMDVYNHKVEKDFEIVFFF